MTNLFTLFFDALRGAVLISGLVVVMMMIIESFNVESDGRMFRSLRKSGFAQVVVSSLLGTIPGCVGGFAAVSLYTHRMLSFGALVAMMIATVGDESFMNVNELNLVGLSKLESVEIGKNSFTKFKNTYQITSDPNRHFYLKNCPKLKSLKIGEYSFEHYRVIEIENVNALEVIEMGDLNGESNNFYYASLELKSILILDE